MMVLMLIHGDRSYATSIVSLRTVERAVQPYCRSLRQSRGRRCGLRRRSASRCRSILVSAWSRSVAAKCARICSLPRSAIRAGITSGRFATSDRRAGWFDNARSEIPGAGHPARPTPWAPLARSNEWLRAAKKAVGGAGPRAAPPICLGVSLGQGQLHPARSAKPGSIRRTQTKEPAVRPKIT